jgi:hypothetical protein
MENDMKRLWLGLGIALATTACSKPQTASENSAESIRTTAMANIVAAIPTPTPTATPEPGNAAALEAGSNLSDMVSNLQSQD